MRSRFSCLSPAIESNRSSDYLYLYLKSFNFFSHLDNNTLRTYINTVRPLLIFEVLIIFILLKITSALHKKIKTVTERNHGRPTKL